MSLAAPVAVESFADRIAAAFAERIPIVCFANDWNGDPTSKHHIMRSFARHVPVLWIEASGMRTPQLSQGRDLRRIVARLRAAFRGMRQAGPGEPHVLSPLNLPLPASRWAQRINRIIYRWSVRRALRQLGISQPPILWVYNPVVAPHLEGMPRAALVYHCVDRWWAFSEYDPVLMRQHHGALCREADVVFASALALLEDCQGEAPDARLMRHGVEWEHFAAAALQPPARPAELAEIEGPILGFFGLIHDWVDQEVLLALADAFPDATLVLIGKEQVDTTRLRERANIRLLGQKPYTELPAYAAVFDLALIPFCDNELTRAVNPIKLREYLSAGLPVVATALPEIELFRANPRVRTARTAAEFVAATRAFLEAPATRDDRIRAARVMEPESWEGRCAEMAGIVQQAAAGRQGATHTFHEPEGAR